MRAANGECPGPCARDVIDRKRNLRRADPSCPCAGSSLGVVEAMGEDGPKALRQVGGSLPAARKKRIRQICPLAPQQ